MRLNSPLPAVMDAVGDASAPVAGGLPLQTAVPPAIGATFGASGRCVMSFPWRSSTLDLCGPLGVLPPCRGFCSWIPLGYSGAYWLS